MTTTTSFCVTTRVASGGRTGLRVDMLIASVVISRVVRLLHFQVVMKSGLRDLAIFFSSGNEQYLVWFKKMYFYYFIYLD